MHGIHHLLDGLIVDAVQQNSSGHGSSQPQTAPPPSIEQEVKLMYARGDIAASTYYRLLEMAQNRQLSWDDLARIRSGEAVTAPKTAVTPPPRQRNNDIVRSLNRLYEHRTKLDAARAGSEQVLNKLETDVARLRQQAGTAAAKAEAAIGDEKSARAYLATRQEALDRAATLEERINALRQDLRRIDDLRDELATREAELKALEANEQLAELEASIREDLVYGR
jgi:prefoldin subunit 5